MYENSLAFVFRVWGLGFWGLGEHFGIGVLGVGVLSSAFCPEIHFCTCELYCYHDSVLYKSVSIVMKNRLVKYSIVKHSVVICIEIFVCKYLRPNF